MKNDQKKTVKTIKIILGMLVEQKLNKQEMKVLVEHSLDLIDTNFNLEVTREDFDIVNDEIDNTFNEANLLALERWKPEKIYYN